MMGVKLLLDVITKTNKTVHSAVQKVVCFSNGTYFTRGLSKIVKDCRWAILIAARVHELYQSCVS